MAILMTWFFFGGRRLLKLIILAVLVAAGITYYQIRFWGYPVISYYANFIAYISGQKTAQEYQQYFDPRVGQTYRLSEYIRLTTRPDDRIFIWGDEPYVYALAHRLPIGRYTVAYHIIDFDGRQETIKDIDGKRPQLIAVMTYEQRKFNELKTRLNTNYVLTAVIDNALVYRRLDIDSL
jgi:hypothetical protein